MCRDFQFTLDMFGRNECILLYAYEKIGQPNDYTST